MSSQVRSYIRGTSPFHGDMVGVVVVVGKVMLRRIQTVRKFQVQVGRRIKFFTPQQLYFTLADKIIVNNSHLMYLLYCRFCPHAS